MRVVQEDLETHWRLSWIESQAAQETFQNVLSQKLAQFNRLNRAGSLASLSKNASSQSQAQEGASVRTTIDNERLALEAIKLYEQIAAAFTLTDESQIYLQGLFQLQGIATEAYSDISALRVNC